MDDEIAISLQNVYKSFNVYYDKANSIKEKIIYMIKSKRGEKREILNDINIEIKKGESVALIGTNGSRQIYFTQINDKNNLSESRKNCN